MTPVNALSAIYDPADYALTPEFEGNIEIATFEFDTEPLVNLYMKGVGTLAEQKGVLDLDWASNLTDEVVFRIFPLGVFNQPGNDATSGMIDIRDFKSGAVFETKGTVFFDMQYIVESNGPESNNMLFETYVIMTYYDASGNYLESYQSTSYFRNVELPSVSTSTEISDYVLLDYKEKLRIPSDAVYMSPCFLTYFTPPDGVGWRLTLASVTSLPFIMQISKNLIIEQTETMQSIDDKLGDIVSGTPEMQDKVDRYNGAMQDNEEKLDSFIARENGIFQNFQKTLDDAKVALSEFLEGPGWTRLGLMIKPILNWSPITNVMIMLVAFVNLSVILFGR